MFDTHTFDQRVQAVAEATAEMQGARPRPVTDLDDQTEPERVEEQVPADRRHNLLIRAIHRDMVRTHAGPVYLRAAAMTLGARRVYEGGKKIASST